MAIKVIFVDQDGNETEVAGNEGDTLLQLARANDIAIEGLCEGTLSCATCHVVVDAEFFSALPAIEEDERDMLELAYHLTDRSRLGCQIRITPSLNGLRLTLPESF